MGLHGLLQEYLYLLLQRTLILGSIRTSSYSVKFKGNRLTKPREFAEDLSKYIRSVYTNPCLGVLIPRICLWKFYFWLSRCFNPTNLFMEILFLVSISDFGIRNAIKGLQSLKYFGLHSGTIHRFLYKMLLRNICTSSGD
jgi:hypothetical protein